MPTTAGSARPLKPGSPVTANSPMLTPGVDLAALRRQARARLEGDDAALDVDLLFCHALGKSRSWLASHTDTVPERALVSTMNELILARAGGAPIAYLLGRRGFWTLDLTVSGDTLIPRADTECLLEAALARLPADRSAAVADLGTGSGAIALALAAERPLIEVIATDLSEPALIVAKGNAERLRIANVSFRFGSWCEALPAGQALEMIVSNPPYLAENDPHLEIGDLRFEPRSALVSGVDGLDAIRSIVAQTPDHLGSGGWLLLEHGMEQGAAIRSLLDQQGWSDVQTLTDIEGRERVTCARRPDA